MKKYILVIVALFLLTGCTNIDNLSYNKVINQSLQEQKVKTNTYLEGYKLLAITHDPNRRLKW